MPKLIKTELLNLVLEIKQILYKAKHNTFYAINTEMLKAYFEIGRKIVEEEQKGEKRARYGECLLENISEELVKEFGRGFDASNLRRMRRFYSLYQKWETVSPKLTWSHYCELIKTEDKQKRKYFENYAFESNTNKIIHSFN
jgi:hypothetical protein